MNNNLKVAILGAGSHIARGLIYNFLKTENVSLHLYTRSSEQVLSFIDSIQKPVSGKCSLYEGYSAPLISGCNLLINCVGVGTLHKPDDEFSRWFTVIEEFDNLSLAYLRQNTETLYISFSSGAVYGRIFSGPAGEDSINPVRVNHLTSQDYYSIARLNAETKHRAFSSLKIVDLRIFSYFSRFMGLSDKYFCTELIDCILNRKTFFTNDINIVRDYVHPKDLFNLIMKCLYSGGINKAFDLFSKSPVEKNDILDYFVSEYGLMYEVEKSLELSGGTGMKKVYYSNYNKAGEIGYSPNFTSFETIKQESEYILKGLAIPSGR